MGVGAARKMRHNSNRWALTQRKGCGSVTPPFTAILLSPAMICLCIFPLYYGQPCDSQAITTDSVRNKQQGTWVPGLAQWSWDLDLCLVKHLHAPTPRAPPSSDSRGFYGCQSSHGRWRPGHRSIRTQISHRIEGLWPTSCAESIPPRLGSSDDFLGKEDFGPIVVVIVFKHKVFGLPVTSKSMLNPSAEYS